MLMSDGALSTPLGDSESDIAAAHRAGLDSVFLRRDPATCVWIPTRPTNERVSLPSGT